MMFWCILSLAEGLSLVGLGVRSLRHTGFPDSDCAAWALSLPDPDGDAPPTLVLPKFSAPPKF